ncbi:MAG: ABC transporter permease subunit [Actinobacteria bacterium]|nr:ABC transporter permease subunit [Actinomycetota bacterium]
MTTITPYRSATQAGKNGFAQVLRAEWTKFRTVRGWLIGMVLAAIVMVLLGVLTGGANSIACQLGPGGQVKHGRACLPPPPPTAPGGQPVSDAFYFVHRPLPGNGSLTARVTSFTGRYAAGQGPFPQLTAMGLQPWSKGGIIIKAGLKQGAQYAAMLVTGSHGVRMQDNFTRDTAGLPGRVSAASPRWLRLTRSGDTITGYDSADGTHWTRVGTAHLAGLPATVQVGLFATSPNHIVINQNFGGGETGATDPSQATAVLDRVSLAGSASGAWTGTEVGGALAAPAPGRFQRAGDAFTVTGSGDIAPVPPGDGNGLGPNTTIERNLVGAFAALIAIAVVAAMFITAEYRRGLIRTTLAASPRRGRVLAAKAIVVAAVTFVVGLAAAIVAVAVGNKLASAKGFYLYPVTGLTEVRVVAGTAALLAVAAVFALGAGALLRRSAVAVTAVIVAIVLPYILAVASVLPAGVADWLLRITPAAGFAIQQSVPVYPQVTGLYTPNGGYFPYEPWVGFAVLCGYAALALGLALYRLRRRDA